MPPCAMLLELILMIEQLSTEAVCHEAGVIGVIGRYRKVRSLCHLPISHRNP